MLCNPWYDDPDVLKSLPALYRSYAAYTRWMVNPSTGLVRGGSFLLSLLIATTRALRLSDRAVVRRNQLSVALDLCDPRMLWVLDEIQGTNPESKILDQCLTEGDTFLDIGANHGSYALLAARRVGPGGFVAAFEPQPRLAALLRTSFQANGMQQASMYEVACSDREGSVEFYIPRANSGSGGLYQEFSGKTPGTRQQVATRRLDDVLGATQLPGKVFLKLDVEGSEYACLTGARGLIQKHWPLILFELNPSSARAAGYAGSDLLGLLSQLGYEKASEIDQFPKWAPLRELDPSQQRNLVAAPSSLGTD